MSAEELYKQIHPVKYFRDYLKEDHRVDGRDLVGTRPLQLNLATISTADGSAVVKLGNTTVVCGIKAELASPTAVAPDQGFLVANIEFTPLCAVRFRPGAPSEEAQVCTRALNDVLANAQCLDLKELCIAKEKLVWTLYCDVTVLNHDGCVLDAAVIATVAALRTVKLPKVEYNIDTAACKVEQETRSGLNVKSFPVSTTFMMFDDKVIVDPTAEEEKLALAVVSIAVCSSELVYIYKPGGTPIEPKVLDSCLKIAINRELKVLELVEKTSSR